MCFWPSYNRKKKITFNETVMLTTRKSSELYGARVISIGEGVNYFDNLRFPDFQLPTKSVQLTLHVYIVHIYICVTKPISLFEDEMHLIYKQQKFNMCNILIVDDSLHALTGN